MPFPQDVLTSYGAAQQANQQVQRYVRAARGVYSDMRRSFRNRQRTSRATRVRHARSRTQTRTRKRGRSGQGVTNQYDRKTIYRRKRMPRRKRARWTSFVKKVHAAAERDLGSKTVVVNDQEDLETIGLNATQRQTVGFLSLYPVTCGDIATFPQFRDLKRIAEIDNGIGNTGKFLFKSGVLDLTIRNSSVEGVATGVACEMDIYELTFSKSFETLPGNKTPLEVFSEGFSDTPAINLGLTQLDIGTRGVTPWDCPQGLGQWGCKIHRKTKFFLGANQTMTYQVRDPKRHVFDKQSLLDSTSANRKGVTKIIMLVNKLVPGTLEDIATVNRLDIGITRKYLYKHNQDSSDADNTLESVP